MVVKRTFDIAFSFIALVISLPLLLIIAIIIKGTSKGPIFYKSKRVGKGGKGFFMYKFRSMVDNASEIGPTITHRGDSRITGIGKFIRAFKIDEFPNLINVLNGDMSIVGPRPELPEFVKDANFQEKGILDIKPGITGLAQLAFVNEAASLKENNLNEDYNKILTHKMKLDMVYKNKQNFRLDLWIIAKTIKTIAFNTKRKKNASKI